MILQNAIKAIPGFVGSLSSVQMAGGAVVGAVFANQYFGAAQKINDHSETQVYGYPLRMEAEMEKLHALAAKQRVVDKSNQERQALEAKEGMKSRFFPLK